jgi:pimeloyl-ACP methyl ester carboxylesterase
MSERSQTPDRGEAPNRKDLRLPAAMYVPGGEERPDAAAGPFDFVSRGLANLTLRMPRYSWVRLLQPGMRRTMSKRGGTYFEIRTEEGLILEGARLPAVADAPRRLPVFYVHGYLETKEVHLREMTRLSEAGHDVYVYDQRAHGRSEGTGMTFGVCERRDLRAVIDLAQAEGWVGERVITMGFSLGGAVVLQHAPDDPRVAGVVSKAPFATAVESVHSFRRIFAPFFDREWVERGFSQAASEAGFVIEEASTLEAIRRIEVPVLLIVGERDKALPAHRHTHVLAAAKQRGTVKLIEVPRATHIDLCILDRPDVDAAVAAFCQALA